MRPSLLERLASFVINDNGCWIWSRQLNNKGYGLISEAGSKRAAHRVMYEQMVGPVDTDLEIDHLCRQKACVNPEHLEVVTASENQRRGSEARPLCRSGIHPWTAENQLVRAKGHRRCRLCEHEADRRRVPRRRPR